METLEPIRIRHESATPGRISIIKTILGIGGFLFYSWFMFHLGELNQARECRATVHQVEQTTPIRSTKTNTPEQW